MRRMLMCYNDCDNNFDEDCTILGLTDQVPEQVIFPFKVWECPAQTV